MKVKLPDKFEMTPIIEWLENPLNANAISAGSRLWGTNADHFLTLRDDTSGSTWGWQDVCCSNDVSVTLPEDFEGGEDEWSAANAVWMNQLQDAVIDRGLDSFPLEFEREDDVLYVHGTWEQLTEGEHHDAHATATV